MTTRRTRMLFGTAKSRILLGLALASSVAGAAWADAFTGPVSKYYLSGCDGICVVQGTSVVASFPMAYGKGTWEGVFAVSQTIRTRARYVDYQTDLGAGEYTLSGNPTGHGYFP